MFVLVLYTLGLVTVYAYATAIIARSPSRTLSTPSTVGQAVFAGVLGLAVSIGVMLAVGVFGASVLLVCWYVVNLVTAVYEASTTGRLTTSVAWLIAGTLVQGTALVGMWAHVLNR